MPEVDTMALYDRDTLIVVIHSGGIYQSDGEDTDKWLRLKGNSVEERGMWLRSTSLGYQVRYEKMAEMCDGKGYFVSTLKESDKATEEGFKARVSVVVNFVIESGATNKLDFVWQKTAAKKGDP